LTLAPDQTPRLVDDDLAVHRADVVGCRRPVGPAHLEPLHAGRRAEAEVHAQVRLRELAPPARDLAPLPEAARGAEDHRADRGPRAAAGGGAGGPPGRPVAPAAGAGGAPQPRANRRAR